MRQNSYDFVSNWYKNGTYMKTYQYDSELLAREPFWEETYGDATHRSRNLQA